MSGERTNRLDFDDYFMSVAILTMSRSADPRTRVGACLVDKSYHILSTGYNGAPKGFDDKDFPWDSKGEETNNILEIKNTFVCHAESNSIDNYFGDKSRMIDATMYVTFFPCVECTKRLIQNGIKRIVYLVPSKYEDYVMASKMMCQKANIKLEKYDGKLLELEMNFESSVDEIKQKTKKMKKR